MTVEKTEKDEKRREKTMKRQLFFKSVLCIKYCYYYIYTYILHIKRRDKRQAHTQNGFFKNMPACLPARGESCLFCLFGVSR